MKIHGKQSLRTTTGFPYAGGEEVDFEVEKISALGKLSSWGSAGVQFVARLDEEIVHFRACDQPKDVQRWLRSLTKDLRAPCPTRDVGWSIAWKDIKG